VRRREHGDRCAVSHDLDLLAGRHPVEDFREVPRRLRCCEPSHSGSVSDKSDSLGRSGATRIEEEIYAEAQRVALALADYPPLARDVHALPTERTAELMSRDDLHDYAGIGTADDYQGQDNNRRERRLAELRFALDRVLGRETRY
jgi:hypothetical protein